MIEAEIDNAVLIASGNAERFESSTIALMRQALVELDKRRRVQHRRIRDIIDQADCLSRQEMVEHLMALLNP